MQYLNQSCLSLTDDRESCQVYLPVLVGLVEPDVVHTISAFLHFCYLACRDFHTEASLASMTLHLNQFRQYRKVFALSGVQPDGFNLPRQHALNHYVLQIRKFGSLNGLCTSITESKHIKAVKEPWRRSNRYNALGQMLLTNQRVAVILMTQIMCQSVILSDYDIMLSSNKSGPAALYILSFSTSICLYFVITWYIRLCNLPRS